jgi:hypothetical protein
MMASARSATWSLVKTLETWLRMVFGLRWRRLAISGVGLVLRDKGENLPFPLGQLGKGVDRRTGSGRSQVVDQSFRNDGPEYRLTGGDGSDCAQDLRLQRSIKQVATSNAQAPTELLVVVGDQHANGLHGYPCPA